MTISRDGYEGPITFICDGEHCGEVEETRTRHFNQALDHIKSLGWKVVKDCGEWFHLCRTCK